MTKTVIVGANHAGVAAANTILDNAPDQEVVMIDSNTNLSYLGCGTALWVGRQSTLMKVCFTRTRKILKTRARRFLWKHP